MMIAMIPGDTVFEGRNDMTYASAAAVAIHPANSRSRTGSQAHAQ
jgi:hypothetical protein